jgi:hypothetical protein
MRSWGHVVSFHPFELESDTADATREALTAVPQVCLQACFVLASRTHCSVVKSLCHSHTFSHAMQSSMVNRFARGEEGVCVPEGEWEERRKSCDQDFLAYSPSLFHRRTMRSMHEFLDVEMLTTVDELERLQNSLSPILRKNRRSSSMRASASPSTTAHMTPDERERIAFLCLEDVKLGSHLLPAIGSLVGAIANVQVLILKGVGLSDISLLRGTPHMLYIDLSSNRSFFSFIRPIVVCLKGLVGLVLTASITRTLEQQHILPGAGSAFGARVLEPHVGRPRDQSLHARR